MTRTSLIAVLALTLAAAPLAMGCSNDGGPDVEAGDEQDVVAATDTAVKKEIADAIVGLQTGGSEGEPDAFKVADFKPRRGQAVTDDLLLKRLLPKLTGVARSDDPIPGLESTDIAAAWEAHTSEPTADMFEDAQELAAAKAAATKWRKMKLIFDAKLTNVRYVDMGYRSSAGGSLETGAVAHVFLGQTATGRVIAIWGIDIWT